MERVRRRARGERGQVAPLVAVILVVAMLGVLVVVRVGRLTADRARARTAADAAALAGASGGRSAAERLAAANGGVLEGFVAVGDDTEVTVRAGEARASARARRGPSVVSSPPETPESPP